MMTMIGLDLGRLLSRNKLIIS